MELYTAQQITKNLLKQYGLNDWNVKFNNAVCSFGRCSYKNRTIKLSKVLVELNDTKIVKDVIIHEIAHALCPKAKHGKEWKYKCIELGGDGQRCFDPKIVKMPESYTTRKLRYKWEYKCPNGCMHGKMKRKRDCKYTCRVCKRVIIFTEI